MHFSGTSHLKEKNLKTKEWRLRGWGGGSGDSSVNGMGVFVVLFLFVVVFEIGELVMRLECW